jgi:hypothetical protein
MFNDKLGNFKKEIIKLNKTTNSDYVTLNVYDGGVKLTDTLYFKSNSGELKFKENDETYSSTYSLNSPEGYKISFNDCVYHNEPIYIYSDIECNNKIGEFNAQYGVNEYVVGDALMGNSTRSLMFSTNLFGTPDIVNANEEMANITKKEYERLLSRVNQMADLLNKLRQ